MKKIDKLILQSFFGPFALTLIVVVFIFLMMHLIKYFEDLFGKDLGIDVWVQLLGYFAIFMIPTAMPLAVLLSSLITFGNLGEHFELTAVKSLGISMTRAVTPIFYTVIVLTAGAFMINNYLVPKAALEAYSLLWDVRQKKPALDLKEGAFYDGIPGLSIKVSEKLSDGSTLKGIIIYDHGNGTGNKDVILADSGRMYTMLNNTYLKMELYNGYQYTEGRTASDVGRNGNAVASKMQFEKSDMVFDLSSFAIKRTNKKWFRTNRIMRNMSELNDDMDSTTLKVRGHHAAVYKNRGNYFKYEQPDVLPTPEIKSFMVQDSIRNANDSTQVISYAERYMNRKARFKIPASISTNTQKIVDSVYAAAYTHGEISSVLSNVRSIKAKLQGVTTKLAKDTYDHTIYKLQWHKILANSVACLVMFLIGAPLGAIIKKGGMGVPVIVSIFFFILLYVTNMLGEKWAKQYLISEPLGVWMANGILLVFGLFFMRQARHDARLFDTDFYLVVWDKISRRFQKAKLPESNKSSL